MGGIQVGYNLAILPNVRVGVESDVQGSSISGDTSYLGNPTSQRLIANLSNGTVISNFDTIYRYFGGGNISAGVNWIATTRARLGYMPTSNFLLHISGGFSYGGIYANSQNNLTQENTIYQTSFNPSYAIKSTTYEPSSGGNGRFSGTKFGYSAGGGIEWMFAHNLSLKAEVIYFNLGSVAFSANPLGINGVIANVPVTRITYDGIIGRTGINYHFNLE